MYIHMYIIYICNIRRIYAFSAYPRVQATEMWGFSTASVLGIAIVVAGISGDGLGRYLVFGYFDPEGLRVYAVRPLSS